MSFAVDVSVLAERYRAVVRWLRIESLLGRETQDDGESPHALGLLDEAYRTLADPLSRAEYLCCLYETDQDSLEFPKGQLGSRGSSLMEQIELEETLVAATNRSDPAGAVAKVLTKLAERSAALDKELHALFADPSPENLNAAREIVRQLEQLSRCRRDAEGRQVVLGRRD
ncbi:molecular chaperone Hsc20 [Thiorhodococcus mannitoliphagus]|uniref:Molecular chaperone Hsc20 n=2 Tax=Thiorhodococcus mannitoliphagus TaxID=329406 RepID=A0A6P1DVF6_9GAMM|nr:iron-sulfur cluster co-chaperone HscB C-terminal domain-containing protein [Thiorhodococcus mannitoliphagus]NEX22327.1 molecular chaperone Hsc20 [Thiorhodococcus mannitoliphagus]